MRSYDLNGTVYVIVSDTGEGVPTHLKDQIMQPFFTTKPTGVGTGMGLSISQMIMADHGAKLYLDSNSKLTSFVCEFIKIS